MLDRLQHYFQEKREQREQEALTELKARYHAFRIFLENNGKALEHIVTIDGRLIREKGGELRQATEELLSTTCELVDGLNLLSDDRYTGLYGLHGRLADRIRKQLDQLEIKPVAESLACVPLSHADAADPHIFGKKAATLARLRQLGLPVPDGFICSALICRNFLEESELAGTIRALLKKAAHNPEDMTTAADRIRELILETPLPPKIQAILEEAYSRLARDNPHAVDDGGTLAVSVRSSGISEDGTEFSFAGQYTSILNVQGRKALLGAFRKVIASAFNARAVAYRQNAGMAPLDFDLAVLCQVMFPPHCAGVLFTRDPSQPDSGRMLVSAVPGLGTAAVGGSVPADLYYPPRVEPVCVPDLGVREYPSHDRSDDAVHAEKLMEGAAIAHKTTREVPAPGGGLRVETVPEEEADQPLLAVPVLEELTRIGEIIESLEQRVQDVEWAWSSAGGISILQARPLRLATSSEGRRVRLPSVAAPLVSGSCASSGKGVGQVRIVRSGAELRQLRDRLRREAQETPAVLILPQSIVDAAYLLADCSGVVIDVGNPTDHLSCVAREYGVPMITGAESAITCLEEGQWVIVDADNGQVFKAPDSVKMSTQKQRLATVEKKNRRSAGTDEPEYSGSGTDLSPEQKRFRELIVPLNLTDAFGATFSPRECRSLHDIIRYTHEMAVLSMFNAGDLVMEHAGNLLHPLEIGIPFMFLVIDVGGGTRVRKAAKIRDRFFTQTPLAKDDILCVPLQALCEGLITPGLNWHSGPDVAALGGIFSRTMFDSRGARPAGSFNYALAARDYLNLNARLEFHFAMLDAVCGRDTHANYIRFRFKGGGASPERSQRRAVFLRHVLEQHGFYTSVVGDLVTASLTGASKEMVYQRLVMLGRLFGFSRFLDGVMTDDEVPLALARQFLAGDYDTRSVLSQYAGS